MTRSSSATSRLPSRGPTAVDACDGTNVVIEITSTDDQHRLPAMSGALHRAADMAGR